MDLPPELRTRIYEIALVKSFPLHLNANNWYYMDHKRHVINFTLRRKKRIVNTSWLQPALTRVCRQIRMEALPIFYSRNTFLEWAGNRYLHFSDLMIWLRCIGSENRNLIQRIQVHLCDNEFNHIHERNVMNPHGLVHLRGLVNQFTYSYGAGAPLDVDILDKMRVARCPSCIYETGEAHLEMIKRATKFWLALRKSQGGLSEKLVQEEVYRSVLMEHPRSRWAGLGDEGDVQRIINELVQNRSHHKCTIWTCGRLLTWGD